MNKRIFVLFFLLLSCSLSNRPKQIEKEVETYNPYPEMVFVEGGEFIMGTNEEAFPMGANQEDTLFSEWEKPQHKVTLSDFYIGKYEITNKQFLAFMHDIGNDSVSRIKGKRGWEIFSKEDPYNLDYIRKEVIFFDDDSSKWEILPHLENHPVRYVQHFGMHIYCEWLSKKTGKKYRLPTEAEWEYAALGGKQSKGYLYPGSNNCMEVSHRPKNYNSGTFPIGLLKPNELGIHDMGGNVRELCLDFCYKYDSLPKINPLYTKNNEKYVYCLISRGANCIPTKYRGTSEKYRITSAIYSITGFRVVMEVEK